MTDSDEVGRKEGGSGLAEAYMCSQLSLDRKVTLLMSSRVFEEWITPHRQKPGRGHEMSPHFGACRFIVNSQRISMSHSALLQIHWM